MNKESEAYKILPNGSESKFSLNNIELQGLPEDSILSEFNGKIGYEVLSDGIILQLKDNGLEEDSLAKEIGRRLSAILFVLKNGKGLEKCDRDFWNHCKSIYLAGYYFCGRFGKAVEKSVKENLRIGGITNIVLRRFDTEITPSLLGCGKFGKPSVKDRLVFDFGHTNVKRGFVRYRNAELECVKEFPYIPISRFAKGTDAIEGEQLNEIIVSVIVGTYHEVREIGGNVSEEIVMCIANNILDGHVASRGRYGVLSSLGDNYQDILKKTLQDAGLNCQLYIMNDVKALTYLCNPEDRDAVVISLGTNLGINYVGPWY